MIINENIEYKSLKYANNNNMPKEHVYINEHKNEHVYILNGEEWEVENEEKEEKVNEIITCKEIMIKYKDKLEDDNEYKKEMKEKFPLIPEKEYEDTKKYYNNKYPVEYMKKIQNKIADTKIEYNKIKMIRTDMEMVPYITIRNIFVFETKIEGSNLSNIFDNIQISNIIPLCMYNKMFKIQKEFAIDKEWIEETNNEIKCYMYCINTEYGGFYKGNYGIITIRMIEDVFEIEISTSKSINLLKESEIIKRLFSQISGNKITTYKKKSNKYLIESEIEINEPFSYIIFSDITMNTDANKMLHLNDRELRPITEKEISFYFGFNEIQRELISCKIKKIGERQCKIKITSSEEKERIENILKCIKYIFKEYYERNYKDIKKEYEDYGIMIVSKEINQQKDYKIKDLKFISTNYGRRCLHIPIFYETKDIKKINDKKILDKIENKSIKFPLTEKGNIEQEKYTIICDNDTLYPRINTRGIPCCMEKSENKMKKETIKNTIITTIKILDRDGQIGELHKSLKKLFLTIGEINATYNRVGTSGDSNESVLTILNKITEKEITREMLIEDCKTNPITQELYESNYNLELKEYLNKDRYIEPKIFINVLQKIYKVKIYLITCYYNKTGGEIILECPKFDNYYYTKNDEYEYAVIILKNYGGESNKDDIPRCEYIMETLSETKTGKFKVHDKLIKKLQEIYEYMYKPELKIMQKEFIKIKKYIKYQKVDFYGKLRYIFVEEDKSPFNNDLILIYIEPIYSLTKIEIKDKIEITIKTSKDKALNFLKKINADEIHAKIINKYIVGYYFDKIFYIPIIPVITEENSNNWDNSDIQYISNISEETYKYDQMDKYSRYYIEYVQYMFSKYMENKNTNEIEKNILLFKNEGFELGEIDINKKMKVGFEIKNNPIIKNNKIICKSEEMIKKLLYTLYIKYIQSKENIINYKNRKYLESYFQSIRDYTPSDDYILVYSKENIMKLIVQRKPDYNLFYNIQTDRDQYFLRWEDKTYIVKKCKNIENACYILQEWNEKRLISNEDKEINTDYDLYFLKRNDEPIKRKEGNKKRKIIQYKYSNILHTFALCEF